MRTIRRIIVHHTAGKDTATAAEIRAEHIKTRGWSDIGYHWLIRRFEGGPWTVEQGRPESVIGAHDQGENSDSIGISIAGDYTRGPVPYDGWSLLTMVVANRCRAYQLDTATIEGHREHEPAATPTACPGFDVADLRRAVRLQLDIGPRS